MQQVGEGIDRIAAQAHEVFAAHPIIAMIGCGALAAIGVMVLSRRAFYSNFRRL